MRGVSSFYHSINEKIQQSEKYIFTVEGGGGIDRNKTGLDRVYLSTAEVETSD